MQFEAHPLANLFPLIEGKDFDELVADIKANGLTDPIAIYQGKILDGRNRYRAASAAGFEIEKRNLRFFRPEIDGDPLKFVISKNLKRRHLTDIQRTSIAGKIANLGHGGDRSKPPIGGLSVDQAAAAFNVAPRQVERARVAHEHGVDEVRAALDRGAIAVSAAESIARLPEQEQPAALAKALPRGARAIMGSRQEPDNSLDFFPTPPWATRALIEHAMGFWSGPKGFWNATAWEPACGEGHIAEVLKEYFRVVLASDVFDYGYNAPGVVHQPGTDFLIATVTGSEGWDWIITNPPFGDKALQFVHRALDLAVTGVAMFFRSQWAVEGVERYESLFRDRPPTCCAFFSERVNLCKGRWDPDGTTATAYCWLIWVHGVKPRAPFWIPPGCRDSLTKPDDRRRFAAWSLPAHDPETGEIAA